MKHFRTALAAALLALAALAPAAGASSFAPPELLPMTNGNLWKAGTLYGGTMYAQAGVASMAKLSPVTLSVGSVQRGLATVSTYVCDAPNKQQAPAVRAVATAFKPATCTLIGTLNTPVNRKIQIVAPATALGSYLSVQQQMTFLAGGRESIIVKWTEVPVYPANPVSNGAPLASSAVYAGAPTAYATRGWSTPTSTSKVGEASQAWVCPTSKPNTDSDPLSQQGCNRVFNDPDSAPGEESFVLGGRIHKEHVQGQYLYYVDFTTIDPIGPLDAVTYQIRSKAQLIKAIPAPRATYAVQGNLITATFTGLDGVDYSFSATRVGASRQFAQRCAEIGVSVQCQVQVEDGSWNTAIVPIGKQATGTVAKRVVTTADAPAS